MLTEVDTTGAARAGAVQSAYGRFMDASTIRDFVARGGSVFIACERRPWPLISVLLDAGHRCFAEKYVQETRAKWPSRDRLPRDLRLHDFGTLQTNKVRAGLRLFDAVESLDRPRLAAALAAELPKHPARSFYLEVNLGREPQKAGAAPEDLDALLEFARDSCRLNVVGLMAIPPLQDDPDLHFLCLRRTADRLRLPECVMGMSRDYAVAIRRGATAIRVARAVFDAT